MRLYAHLGDVVGHTDSAIILAPVDERAVEFYGWVAGRRWPGVADLAVNGLAGSPSLSAANRLAEFQRQRPARWFIVAEMGDLKGQPDLEALLRQYKLVESGPSYVIYDMAKP